MASPSTVITMGFGSFGSVNLLPTLGYGIGEAAAVVLGPYCVEAVQTYTAGARTEQSYLAGARAEQIACQ